MRWQPSYRSYENHFPSIAEIEKVLSQRSLESGFHMIAMIATIAEPSFFSAIVANIWKQGLSNHEHEKSEYLHDKEPRKIASSAKNRQTCDFS